MNEWIIRMLLPMISKMLNDLVTVETIQKYGDQLFDFLENAIADSATKVDDVVVLPIIKKIRETLGIPDNDA